MKMNQSERDANTKGHDLIAQGRALIAQAERAREARRKRLDTQWLIEENRRKEASRRADAQQAAFNLRDDILKSKVGYPSIDITSATANTADNWSSGEIVIRFSMKQ
jgi:hypothetical protein